MTTPQGQFAEQFTEQFSAATKANLDTQLAILSSFANKAFESVERVVELNLAAAKTTFEESNAAIKQFIAAKDPQEFFSLSAAHVQPNTEKASEYTRHLAAIISNAQAELSKITEAHVADTNHKVITLIDEIAKNAPAGSENAIALLKSAIGSANASYEQFSKSAKQASEALETNLNQAVNQISKAAAPKTTSRGSKKAS